MNRWKIHSDGALWKCVRFFFFSPSGNEHTQRHTSREKCRRSDGRFENVRHNLHPQSWRLISWHCPASRTRSAASKTRIASPPRTRQPDDKGNTIYLRVSFQLWASESLFFFSFSSFFPVFLFFSSFLFSSRIVAGTIFSLLPDSLRGNLTKHRKLADIANSRGDI